MNQPRHEQFSGLAAIEAPHSYAGVIMHRDQIIKAPPLLQYMRSWTYPELKKFVTDHHWRIAELRAPFVEVQVKAVGSSQPDRQRARRHCDSRAGRHERDGLKRAEPQQNRRPTGGSRGWRRPATRRDTLRRIRALRPGTTARRTTLIAEEGPGFLLGRRRHMKFVVVNGRTPSPQSFCALCCEPIGESYLRELTTRLSYCDHKCYDRHCKLLVQSL